MRPSLIDSDIDRLRGEHAALRTEWEGVKRAYYVRKFDPGQPRAPKGTPTGGQWIRAALQFALGLSPAGRAMSAALTLFSALSAQNDRNKRAVIAFGAAEFQPDGQGELNLNSVTQLNRDEVGQACPRLGEVQERTDNAVDAVRLSQGLLRPSEFGTAVHTNLKRQIEGLDDPNFRAEVSYLKSKEESYGKKGSIRIDVLENVGDGTVCVYDIKTGLKGLSLARMTEIAGNVTKAYKGTRRIIVTEVRPRR